MGKLLIIDEEETVLRNLKSYLETKSFSVFIASTGESGLELLKEDKPDLLLLEIYLKEGIGGPEFLRRALELSPKLKVAILTALIPDEEIKKRCLNLGARLFLEKPVSLFVLTEGLRKLTEDRRDVEIINIVKNLKDGRKAQMKITIETRIIDG